MKRIAINGQGSSPARYFASKMQNKITQKDGIPRRIRKSYEAGHRPKFLVLVDESDDCGKAVYYASRRAVRLGAQVSLLRVVDPPQTATPFLGVAQMLKMEAEEEARQSLARWTALAQAVATEPPETLIEQGDAATEIFRVIDADEDMAMLVLAAGSSHEDPGPLVAQLGRTAGTYPIPVVIVPTHLSDEELDALS